MPNISDSVRSTRTEDGRILLDLRHGQMFSLNVVGSRILDLIEQGWDEARISEEISRTYGTTIEVARTDVHDFIEALCKDSIIQADASGDSI
jgi:Coenzyme PQQ synthesis protein D (PqqD)